MCFCITSGKKRCRASGNWLVVQRLLTTTLYKLLRLAFITVQRIYWQLNGTAQKLREARLPHNYDRSAQVLDVILCHKFCPALTTTVDNFLCTHNRFENPQYIIDNDNVTLLTINERDAVFCEAKEKGGLPVLTSAGKKRSDQVKIKHVIYVARTRYTILDREPKKNKSINQ